MEIFSWIPYNLSFLYILFREKRLQTMLWHSNIRVKHGSAFAFIFGVNWREEWMYWDDKIHGIHEFNIWPVNMDEWQFIYLFTMNLIYSNLMSLLHWQVPNRQAENTVMRISALVAHDEKRCFTLIVWWLTYEEMTTF